MPFFFFLCALCVITSLLQSSHGRQESACKYCAVFALMYDSQLAASDTEHNPRILAQSRFI